MPRVSLRRPSPGDFAREHGSDSTAAVYATFTGRSLQGGQGCGLRCCAWGLAPYSATRPRPRYTVSADKPSARIHISVPVGRSSRPGSEDPGRGYPQVSVSGAGVAAAVAAAADHGGGHGARPDRPARSFDDAYGWISAAVGRRLTTPELLGKALAARSRMRWRAWVTGAIQDAADGVHSPLERSYVHGVERAHGLPGGAAPGQAQAWWRKSATWTTCTRSMGYASNWTESRLTPAEGRWRDTRRDNANLVQGTRDAEIRVA